MSDRNKCNEYFISIRAIQITNELNCLFFFKALIFKFETDFFNLILPLYSMYLYKRKELYL